MFSLRYGYYGNYRMVLGPTSSRLMKASSLFVKQIEVKESDKKGVLLYGFDEKPELNAERNWSISSHLIVGSYGRKVILRSSVLFNVCVFVFPSLNVCLFQGFSLWLNQGSRIRVIWEAQSSTLNDLQVFLIKG